MRTDRDWRDHSVALVKTLAASVGVTGSRFTLSAHPSRPHRGAWKPETKLEITKLIHPVTWYEIYSWSKEKNDINEQWPYNIQVNLWSYEREQRDYWMGFTCLFGPEDTRLWGIITWPVDGALVLWWKVTCIAWHAYIKVDEERSFFEVLCLGGVKKCGKPT